MCISPKILFLYNIVHIDNDLSQYSRWLYLELDDTIEEILHCIHHLISISFGGSREEEGRKQVSAAEKEETITIDSGRMLYTSRHPITFLKVDKTIFFRGNPVDIIQYVLTIIF